MSGANGWDRIFTLDYKNLHLHAPDLLHSRLDAFTNLTAEKLVSWDTETISRYLTFIEDTEETQPHVYSRMLKELATAHHIALLSDSTSSRYNYAVQRTVTTFLQRHRPDS